MRTKNHRGSWLGIIKGISTPLGFYVLALLIIEATLSLVLVEAPFEPARRYSGFLWMIAIFFAVVLIVTALAVWRPKHLLFSKEDHVIDASALRDQATDLIVQRVKPDALRSAANDKRPLS